MQTRASETTNHSSLRDHVVEIDDVDRSLLAWYGSLVVSKPEDLAAVKRHVTRARAEEVVREGADG